MYGLGIQVRIWDLGSYLAKVRREGDCAGTWSGTQLRLPLTLWEKGWDQVLQRIGNGDRETRMELSVQLGMGSLKILGGFGNRAGLGSA